MDNCGDGEMGDGSSQTLLPRWWDRDDGSPQLCPLLDEHLLVGTIKWQRRSDGKQGRGGDGAVAVPMEPPGVPAAVAEVRGHPGSRHNSVISVTPHNHCSHYTLPSRPSRGLPAFPGGDKPSPFALSGQPTPRIQQNVAAVPTHARASAAGCSFPQPSPSKPPQG